MKKLKFSIIAICLLTAMLLTSCSNTLPQVTKKPPTKTTTTPIVTEPIVEKGFYEYCDYEDAKYYIVSVYLKNPATIETLYKIYDGATDKDKYYKALCYINKTDELTFDSGKDIYVLVSPEKYPDIDFDAGFETEVNTSVTTQEPIISTKPDITTNKSTTEVSKTEKTFIEKFYEHYYLLYTKYSTDKKYKEFCDQSLVNLNDIDQAKRCLETPTTYFYFPETYSDFVSSITRIETQIVNDNRSVCNCILVEHLVTIKVNYNQKRRKYTSSVQYEYTDSQEIYVTIGNFYDELSIGSIYYKDTDEYKVKSITITPIEIDKLQDYKITPPSTRLTNIFSYCGYDYVILIIQSTSNNKKQTLSFTCKYVNTPTVSD